MSEFKVGQEVIFSKEALDLKDVKGVVHTPFWQVSASDWPEVIVTYEDGGKSAFVNVDDVRPAVDPYEYAATWLDPYASKEAYWEVLESEWGTLEEAQEEARHATEVGNKGAKIVRRRKAGEPEDYNV